MNNPKDIIGIVKELQHNANGLTAVEYTKELLKQAPFVAQALLIAVEALEEIPGGCHECDASGISAKALSRIRSLPSGQ